LIRGRATGTVAVPMLPSPEQAIRPSTRDLLVLNCVALVLLLPFIAKPIHNDDPVYVWAARHITQDPLDFYSSRANWEGHEQPLYEFFESPPFTSFVLAGAGIILGWSEVALHAPLLIANLLTVIGMYLLAARFCRRPLVAGLILLLCPAFFVSATTLMAEPLLMCLWVWSIFLWTAGHDRGRAFLLPIAGVITAAAVMTKYLSISLLPLMLTYSLLRIWLTPEDRRERTRNLLRLAPAMAVSFAIPLLTLLLYEQYTAAHYGVGLLRAAAGYAARVHTSVQTHAIVTELGVLAFIGGGLLAPAVVGWFTLRRAMRWATILSIPVLTLIVSALIRLPRGWTGAPPVPGGVSAAAPSSAASAVGIGWFFYLQYGLQIAVGLTLLIVCVTIAVRPDEQRRFSADSLFLLLWIVGIVVFAAVFNWSLNARTILPMVPPACMLVTRALDRRFPSQRLPIPIVAAMPVVAIIALIVAGADYRLAVTCRFAAERVCGDLHPDTNIVWYAGHSGFDYYMQQHGAHPLPDTTAPIHPGDFVVYPVHNFGASPGARGLTFLTAVPVGSPGFAATMQSDMGAEFYSSFGYGLPFVFGPIQQEVFVVYRATPNVQIIPP
jgi:4-amino-4-deoxy-L-arabinose transferase-like glycosyltransferase